MTFVVRSASRLYYAGGHLYCDAPYKEAIHYKTIEAARFIRDDKQVSPEIRRGRVVLEVSYGLRWYDGTNAKGYFRSPKADAVGSFAKKRKHAHRFTSAADARKARHPATYFGALPSSIPDTLGWKVVRFLKVRR